MARLKKYMYQINKNTIGFKWWWVFYQKTKYRFLYLYKAGYSLFRLLNNKEKK